MNDIEKYEFDRQGYLIVKDLIGKDVAAKLLAAVNSLESEALERMNDSPRKKSVWGPDYYWNQERGYFTTGSNAQGGTVMIEDFFNAIPSFDILVNHAKTMSYIDDIVQGKIRVNNSEIRIRYPGNATGVHMGGPIDHKYRYSFNARGIDCMMVRMIYFLHDVGKGQGEFCVVAGTHKTNYVSPYGNDPDTEPGMIGLEVEAGDGILFTENLRHGGLTNHSEQTRKTLHVGYGPSWMMSQNIATMDEPQYVLPETLARYDEKQRRLFELH